MTFFSRFALLPAIRDLRRFLNEREPHELWFGILAVVLTGTTVVGFILETPPPPVKKPEVIFVQSWPLSRTDREIIAQQKVDQVKRDREDAELRARQLKLQRQFQVVDKQLKAVGL